LGLSTFSPENQDKGAVRILKIRGVIEALKDLDLKEASSRAAGTWRALPGKLTQSKLTMNDVQQYFYEGLQNEISNKSTIAAPKGALSGDN